MILVRHGQTEFNVVYTATRTDPGIADPPVNALGHDQAAATAAALAPAAAGAKLRCIITSPYLRTLQTTAIIAAALDLPVVVDPLVRERAAFSCDIGTPRAQLLRQWPDYDFARVTEETWWYQFDTLGPESEDDVLDRGNRFLSAMADGGNWDATIVVSHREFIRPLIGEILPNGAWRKLHRPTGPD